eukprot:scaffold50171_cov31-Tisochrysis_lutea.AAC.3
MGASLDAGSRRCSDSRVGAACEGCSEAALVSLCAIAGPFGACWCPPAASELMAASKAARRMPCS